VSETEAEEALFTDEHLRTVVALNMYDELKGFLLSYAESAHY